MDSGGSTNAELDALAAELRIPNYVRCRIKDELRGQTATACECGIVNLQNTDQAGSHWVLYFKGETKARKGEGAQSGARKRSYASSALLPYPPLLSKDMTRTFAYSSFGDPVPQELVEYLGDKEEGGGAPFPPIYTSDIQIQDFSKKSCGYYCIAILYLLSQKIPFEDIILWFKG